MHRVLALSLVIVQYQIVCRGEDTLPVPAVVELGVYVNRLNDVSLKDGKIAVDIYVWFRWRDKDLKPHEAFDLVNGEVTSKSGLMEADLDGVKYASLRVRGIVNKVWDISRFPFDSHEISIEIESTESEIHKLVYVPDVANSGVNADARIAGWTLTPRHARVEVYRYATNYGDTSLPTGAESAYSRFIYSVHISRPGYSLFIKLFTGLFIAAGIGFLSLLIRPIDLDPRFGLGVGAMFAAVASQYVLDSNLPDAPGLTLADKLHVLTFLFIFITLLESTISLRLWNRGRQALSEQLDRYSLVCIVLCFVSLCVWLVWFGSQEAKSFTQMRNDLGGVYIRARHAGIPTEADC